jgi:hypothetical protein
MNMQVVDIVNIEKLFFELSKDWFQKNDYSYVSEKRSDIYTAALVMWLAIFQRLNGMPLQGAVISILNEGNSLIANLNNNSRKLKSGKVSVTSGGFSQAKSRLKSDEIEDLIQSCFKKLSARVNKTSKLEKDLDIFLVDGSCVTVSYTKCNAEKFVQLSAGEKGKLHFPRIRILTAHSLATGLAVQPQYGEITESEQSLTWKIILSLPPKATVMGDRNFGVFSVVYRICSTQRGALVRMNEAVFNRVVGQQSSDCDLQKTWTPSARDLKTTPEIPPDAKVKGRFIKITVRRNGFRPEAIFFFTTLDISVEKIAKLYLQRQRIETNIRQIKEFLKLEFICARTPDMIKKEIYFAFLAFNLVTTIMAVTAQNLKLDFSRISFTASIRLILHFGPRINKASTSQERRDLLARFETAMNQTKIPLRKKPRAFPRVVKRNKSKFPLQSIVENA